jgi:signal transduction histidine kinase
MFKFLVRRWSERPRMLVFMLGVMLPAAALVVDSVWELRQLQRDKAIEAVFQRDFQEFLAIAEKQIDARAYGIAEQARSTFPDANQGDQLEAFLVSHKDIAHAFLWTGKGQLETQSQPDRMSDPEFVDEAKKMSYMMGHWFDVDSNEEFAKLKKMQATEGRRISLEGETVTGGDTLRYLSWAVFIPRGATAEHPALAGFVYDADYLKDKFFPQALDEVLPTQDQRDSSHPQTTIMVRTSKEHTPFAASACWDGGLPEVERSFDDVFPGLILGAKLRGTTIANISNHFLRTTFLVFGALSLLMGGGMLLAYRNVARELALAKLKSDFVSNVSHELRTPLALIRLYAETLELGRISSPGKHQEYYEIIRKESERLTSLINNILDFSRIESGKKEYSFRETDVADLVRSTLDSYRFEIEQNGFQFEEKIDNDVPQLWMDREAIARSLLNLVNNAVKYSATEKYLGVHLYRHNGGVNLEVVDHGIGIPAKEQPKIFEKFYRVGDPVVHNTKGSGLGLSLVRHIVQAHGGEVAVESEPGQGSKFIITLPVKTAEIEQAKRMSA